MIVGSADLARYQSKHNLVVIILLKNMQYKSILPYLGWLVACFGDSLFICNIVDSTDTYIRSTARFISSDFISSDCQHDPGILGQDHEIQK